MRGEKERKKKSINKRIQDNPRYDIILRNLRRNGGVFGSLADGGLKFGAGPRSTRPIKVPALLFGVEMDWNATSGS